MLAAYVTPRTVAAGLVAETLLLVGLYLPAALGLTSRFLTAEAIVMTVSGVLAFGIAALLSLAIAAEHRHSPWMRLAWLMLAANAAISLVKRSVGSPLLDLVIPSYRDSHLRGLLDNLLVVPANLCLLASVVAMWWALHQIRAGFRVKPLDYVGMAGVMAVLVTIVALRQDLSQGQSPYLMSRILQPVGLVLLGVISAFGLVLQRYALQMGDGRLAAVMRWLMVYVLLRGGLVLLRGILSPRLPVILDSPPDLDKWTFDVLWQVVQWTAAMAAACRVQLTARAAEQLKQLRAA